MGTLANKLVERERVHHQNRDLVTKNCGQQSQIDALRRKIQSLEDENNQLIHDKQKQGGFNRPGMGTGNNPNFRNNVYNVKSSSIVEVKPTPQRQTQKVKDNADIRNVQVHAQSSNRKPPGPQMEK